MIADPKPQDSVLDIDAKGAMVKADSARPEPAHALELKGGVTRIIFEESILLARQPLHSRPQSSIRGPKLRRGEVPQNSVDLPAA